MNDQDPYATLLQALEYPESGRLRLILEHLLSPDQAKMVASLPGTAADVSGKTGFDTGHIQGELDKLFFRGVVFPRGDFINREYFRFARTVMQFHDATQASQTLDPVRDRHFYELWHDFVINEWYPDLGRALVERGKPGRRIVPAYQSVKENPELLPHEDFRELLKAQDLIAVTPCSCRYRTTAVDQHCEYTAEEERWNCLQFGRGAEYAIKRGSGVKLELDEALELLDKIEADGLLHIWFNNDAMTGVPVSCQCCRDCCQIYVPLDMVDGSIGNSWEKSRFQAVVDTEKCNGCQNCVDRCQFDAIEMIRIKDPNSTKKKKGKLKSVVIPENCWGCGVCVMACDKTGALSMEAVRPPEFIPAVE